MARQEVFLIVLGIALGACITMGVWVGSLLMSPIHAYGGTVDTQGTFSVASCKVQGRGDAEAFWIFDHESKKIAVYFMNGKTLEFLAVRDMRYDLTPAQWPLRQTPTIDEMKKQTRGKQ